MFSYFVQGESVYAVALHICSLWHDKRGVAGAQGGKYLWKREKGKADSCKLTAADAAGAKENCAAAQEKQLTMLQLAVAAASAPTCVVVVASSCHCSWLWFSDCIAQDFNATVFARRVRGGDKRRRKRGLASLHMLAAAHACKHKAQSQTQQQHRQLQASAPALALLPIVAISRIQYK